MRWLRNGSGGALLVRKRPSLHAGQPTTARSALLDRDRQASKSRHEQANKSKCLLPGPSQSTVAGSHNVPLQLSVRHKLYTTNYLSPCTLVISHKRWKSGMDLYILNTHQKEAHQKKLVQLFRAWLGKEMFTGQKIVHRTVWPHWCTECRRSPRTLQYWYFDCKFNGDENTETSVSDEM